MSESNQIVWKDRKRTLFGLPWTFTKYVLTEEKLLIKTGVFNTKEEEVRLYRIMDITLNRSFRDRFWRLGTIHCCSADKSSPEFNICRIKKPRVVKEMLSDLVEKERMEKRVASREYMTDDGDCDEDDDID